MAFVGDGRPTAYTNVAKNIDAQYFQLDNWKEIFGMSLDKLYYERFISIFEEKMELIFKAILLLKRVLEQNDLDFYFTVGDKLYRKNT